MTEPAKDKAELVERLAKEVLCDGIIICHYQKSCVGCFAKADAAIAAIREAGWAVVPQTELDALRAKNARLREALTWFVENDDTNEGDTPMPEHGGRSWNEINAYWIEGLNAARAALESSNESI